LVFEVIPIALTVEQVKDMDLPSTPLKETERRADGWRARYGVEQTEIDALATLRPDTQRQIVEEAIAPYYDATLVDRVQEAAQQWEADVQVEFQRQATGSDLDDLVDLARSHLRDLAQALTDIQDAAAAIDFTAPKIDLPEPDLQGERKASLVDSDMSLLEHIEVLRQRKDYSAQGEQE
jgi:hypothetical protein